MLAHLFAATHQIGRGHPIFCFPVGDNPDYVSGIAFFAYINGQIICDKFCLFPNSLILNITRLVNFVVCMQYRRFIKEKS